MGWPLTYLKLHQPLKIRVPHGVVGETQERVLEVRVQRFQNMNRANPKENTTNVHPGLQQIAVQTFWEFQSAPPSESEWVRLPAHFSETSISNVHTGKGSATAIAGVLQLLIWSNSRRGKSLSPFWGFDDTYRWLQNYCQLWIGLDCLGFVANAINFRLGDVMRPQEITNMAMRGYTENSNRILQSLYELEEGNAIVYLNNELGQSSRHIGLIDSVGFQTKDNASVKVVESLEGAGLQTDLLEITRTEYLTETGPVYQSRRMSTGRTDLAYLCRVTV
jgi:hypothetical protein